MAEITHTHPNIELGDTLNSWCNASLMACYYLSLCLSTPTPYLTKELLTTLTQPSPEKEREESFPDYKGNRGMCYELWYNKRHLTITR